MTIEKELKQLHEDCEKLKERNNTPKAQEEHRYNELHEFCRWIEYYEQYYPPKRAKWYAKYTMENLVYKMKEEENDT